MPVCIATGSTCAKTLAGLREAVTTTLRTVTRLGGNVDLVAAGTLANDGKVIADERH